MNPCKVCLTLTDAQKDTHPDYHDRCVRELFGSFRVRPQINIRSSEFQREARMLIQTERLSISGVQAKLSATVKNGEIALGTTDGEYILKPCPADYPHLPANEHLSMRLARLAGLDTAQCALLPFRDGTLTYIVKRYDRRGDVKIHQEDMMQAMGHGNATSGSKYQGSYEAIGRAIGQITGNLMAPADFMRRLIFMYLIGNGDYHQKNISLLYPGRDLKDARLTPVYDAVNTHLYGDNEFLCLDFFEGDGEPAEFKYKGFYSRPDFIELGERLGIKSSYLKNYCKKLAMLKNAMLVLVEASFLDREQKEQYGALLQERLSVL